MHAPLWTIDDDDPDEDELEQAFKARYGEDDDTETDDTLILDMSALAQWNARLEQLKRKNRDD